MATPGLSFGERTYRQNSAWRAALALLIFLPIAIAWSVLDDSTPTANPILMWITAGASLLFIAACVAIGKTVLTITEQGVRRESVFGRQEVFWSQVKETRYVERPIRLGAHFGLIGMIMTAATKSANRSKLVLTIISSEGTRLKVTSNFRQAREAANAILAKILPTMIASSRSRLQGGEILRFGSITLTLTDLAWKSLPGVPLTELEKAEIASGSLRVKRTGKWTNFISISSDKIPNVFVLLELLDEFAPQLRQRLDPLARVRN
jgi:hypothetical protein